MTYAVHEPKTHNQHGPHAHDAGDSGQEGRSHDHRGRPDRQPPDDDHAKERLISTLDTLGIAASSLCLVHCLAMPLVIGFLPLLGWQFLEGHRAHVILAGFVLTFALTAVVPGYLKHRRRDILLMMSLGLLLVLSATFALPESWELPTITVGNLILVATHWRNRMMHKCTDHSH
ncbi:MAG TPA: MerC domain-containing protein [Planktothrix sp.]|jgi:hypothetical protein